MTRTSRQAVTVLVVRDLEAVDLGDERRDARLLASAAALAGNSRRSIPEVFRSEADREAFYRLLRNPAVEPDDVLTAHVEATAARAAACRSVVVAHDESDLKLKGSKRVGLGTIANGARGLYLRGSLAVDVSTEARTALGVLGMERYVHQAEPRLGASAAVMRSRKKPQVEKKTDWWRKSVLAATEALAGHPDVVHVMDRDADGYPLMSALVEAGCHFVIRVRHNRVLEDGQSKLKDALWNEEGHVFREVPLSRRRPINRRGAHPARKERTARLCIRAASITVPRPEEAASETTQLAVNVVEVYEPRPPPGEVAVEWLLLTTKPVTSLAEMSHVVDCYRARWRIEEYFKALKTGCAVETRQLESLETISNALAIFVPIAWALLSLRDTARVADPAPATLMFSEDQLQLLRALGPESKLRASPTMREAMLAIAHLGGHIRRNGEPGWEVLGRGFVDFVAAERGWRAARGAKQ